MTVLAAFLTFVAVFLGIAGVGILLLPHESAKTRIAAVIEPAHEHLGLRERLKSTRSSLHSVVERFESVLPRSKAEMEQIQQRLARAGYRGEGALNNFYSAKVIVPLSLAAVALVSGLGAMNPFLVYSSSLGMGFLLPNFWLDWQVKRRQKQIRRSLPDVLDLLVICIEAGQSMDQATSRTTEELSRSCPELCDELNLLLLEQRAGRPRSETWKNLAARTGEEGLRNLAAMIVQSEQLGTSIARMLRVQADTLRTQRVQQLEEQAARTSVKLVFPLVLFIFPALFLVTLGPAVIQMLDSFQALTNP
jgi:tight adherence protein C